MLHATLVDLSHEADNSAGATRDADTLLEAEDRAAMALLRLVTATALAIGLLGLALRLLN
ncbi:hypothetical protein [Aquabacterium sp.]|uniref:hypothetical protein n=1 Tax=Aquabacterium sp. TaxID=1872578 RepID=UPI0037836E11